MAREPLVEFTVKGRAVPWKASTVVLRKQADVLNDFVDRYAFSQKLTRPRKKPPAFKDKKLEAWQETVAQFATIYWRQAGYRAPHLGPVSLYMEFRLHRNGQTPPDLTNLVKATEDALQHGKVIGNDRQVEGQQNHLIWVPSPSEESVLIAVYPAY